MAEPPVQSSFSPAKQTRPGVETQHSYFMRQSIACRTAMSRDTGLRDIIAVHDTTLRPGLSGTSLRRYDSSAEALLDVLRLSEGMTYKAAVAGLPLGGAKAVILADGKEESDPALRAAR